MKLALLFLCVNSLHQVNSVGYYYRKPGLLTSNSCAVSPCPTCPTGQYMQDCAGFSSAVINGPAPGSCTPCTAVANSVFTSDGGITDSCQFACNEGYFDSGGRCSPKIYVVKFQVAVTLPAASTFNVRKYIASMASLAGISGCAYSPTTITPNILYETACTTPAAVIRATVDTTSTVLTNSFTNRRLLAAGTASVVTEIRIESNAAKATTVQQSITVSAVNTQLSTNAVGTTTTVSAPIVTVVAVVPTSTSSRSTSKPMSTMTALLMSTTSINQHQETTPAPVSPPPVPPPPDTTSTASTPASSSNIGIIIGAAAGGVILVAVIIAAAVLLSMGTKKVKSAPNKQVNNNGNNPIIPKLKKAIRLPGNLASNAILVYAEVPQQLYPGYPLRHIRIQGM